MRTSRWARIIVTAVLGMLGLVCPLVPTLIRVSAVRAEPPVRPRVGLFLWSDAPEPQAVARAVREGFERAGIDAEFTERSAAGDDAKAHAALGEFRVESVDLVVAIGDVAALRARNSVRDRPVVFAGAHSPARLTEEFGDDLCGTYSRVSPRRLIEELRRAIPGVETFGVAMAEGDEFAREFHERLVAAAKRTPDSGAGRLEIVSARLSPGDESTPPSIAWLGETQGRPVLLIPPSVDAETVKTLETTAVARPPLLVGTTAQHLDAGCPLVVRTAARAAGQRAVGLIRRVLAGDPAREVGTREVTRILIEVNLPAARRADFAPPLTLLVRADRLIPSLATRR